MIRSRRVRATVAAVVALALGSAAFTGVAGATTTSQRTARTPHVKVSPSSNLAAGQIVTVSGSGFPANAEIGVTECKSGEPTTSLSDCSLPDGEVLESGSHGRFTVTYQVERHITINATQIDCATKGACALGAATYPRIAKAHAGQVLEFNPKLKPIAPSIHLSQSTSLASNQSVTITGKNFSPNGSVSIDECSSGGTCQYYTNDSFAPTSAAGTFSATYRPSADVLLYGKGRVRLTHCSKAPGCVVEAQSDGVGGSAKEAVSFDPKAPPVTPDLHVSRRTALAEGQIVTVRGSDLDPHVGYTVTECKTGRASILDCGLNDSVSSESSAAGEMEAHLPVTAHSTTGAITPVDCDTTSCSITIVESGDEWFSSSERISFNSSLPPVTPSETVTPSSGLVDGQIVTVSGGDFPTGSTVDATECLASQASTPECGDYGGSVETNQDGSFSEGYTIESTVPSATSTSQITCANSGADRCDIVLANQNDPNEFVAVPITFGS